MKMDIEKIRRESKDVIRSRNAGNVRIRVDSQCASQAKRKIIRTKILI